MTLRFNPFNPQQPARPDFFVGREPEITEFEKALSQTIHGSPMNISVTGNRGMGKTSILVKFEDIARKENCLVLRLSNYEGNVKDIVQLADYIASNLKRELLSRGNLVKDKYARLKEWASTLKPTIGWGDISLSVEKQQVVQEILRERLEKLWIEMKEEYGACVILIDESESLEQIGALTFLREVFQRLATDCKYTVVLAGKLNFPERMSESFSPLNRYFPCSRLKPFKIGDVKAFIIKRLGSVAVGIDEVALTKIVEKCEGHPYVVVATAYLLFDSLNENEKHITKDVVDRAQSKINARLAQDFFAPMYHPLTPKAKEILKSIALNIKGREFTFKDSVKWSNTGRTSVSPYVQELLRKGILNKPERAKYQIFHSLFLDYIQELAKEE